MDYDLKKTYLNKALPELIGKFGYKNRMDAPKITKVVVNTGVGSVKDGGRRELIGEHLAVITGQVPSKRQAKKSIATFKLRKGGHVGYAVTLRGNRMYDFLNRLIFVAIPRKRDFRGLSPNSVDEAGNLTIGFRDHLVFPEMVEGDLRDAFGISVTIVTTARNKEKAFEFFNLMGFPFVKR